MAGSIGFSLNKVVAKGGGVKALVKTVQNRILKTVMWEGKKIV